MNIEEAFKPQIAAQDQRMRPWVHNPDAFEVTRIYLMLRYEIDGRPTCDVVYEHNTPEGYQRLKDNFEFITVIDLLPVFRRKICPIS